MARREPMSSVDRAWLMMDDPTNPMVINGFWIFKELLQYEHVLAVLEERLLIHERFRQRVVAHRGALRTRAYWKIDPEFDLHAHVGHIVLPSPGDTRTLNDTDSATAQRSLGLEPASVGVHPHRRLRGRQRVFRTYSPLYWRRSVTGKGAAFAGGCVCGGRMARAVCSGRASRRNGVLYVPRAGGAARAGTTILQEGGKRVRRPSDLLSLAARGGELAGKFAAVLAKLALMRTDDKTAFKGEVGVGKAVAWSEGISLDDVKFVKNTMGATVNDVLVAAMAGALRRYVEARGDNPEGKEIRAMVPVDIRGPEDTKLTNRFALVYLPPVYQHRRSHRPAF